MARQVGIVKIQGTIGDISFYKSVEGHLVRSKGGVSKKRILTDPNFQRTRENASEFGQAGKLSKILLNDVRHLVYGASDSRMFSRLLKTFLSIIKEDNVSARGERTVRNKNVPMLSGFEFNLKSKVANTIYVPLDVEMTVPGEFLVKIRPFTPQQEIRSPIGATHFQLVCAIGRMDYEKEIWKYVEHKFDVMQIDNNLSKKIEKGLVISGSDFQPVLIFFGIEFYQEVNKTMYQLNNGSYNSFSIYDFIQPMGKSTDKVAPGAAI